MASTRLILSALVLTGLSTIVGCSANASSEDANAGASDDALTGINDLSEMEAALGLNKDEKNADGSWNRPQAKLENGPCYKKLVAGPNGSQYEFRRYYEGAAFFKKQGAGAQSGSDRPVLCVDVDITYDGGNTNEYQDTIEVSDIEIDSVLRYRLGKPTGGDGAAGTFYDGFVGGYVSYHGGYCPKDGWDATDAKMLDSWCFGAIDFPGNNEANGDLQLMVYQFAYNRASASSRFSMKNDAAGRFVSMEGNFEKQTIHFEKVDASAERDSEGNHQALTIRSKSGATLAHCEIVNGDETQKATCTGL